MSRPDDPGALDVFDGCLCVCGLVAFAAYLIWQAVG